MQRIIKYTLLAFVGFTLLTGLLAMFGLIYAWLNADKPNPVYLNWLLTFVLGEIVAVVFLFVRKGLNYLPEVQVDKTQEATLKFMEKFVSQGTSAIIVSNRVSWLAVNEDLIDVISQKVKAGVNIEIIIPNQPSPDLREKLPDVNFIVTGEKSAPEARFTLINSERNGSEKLAIARGVHPEHEITTFDSNSGPQIIVMAKDIVRKSREVAKNGRVE